MAAVKARVGKNKERRAAELGDPIHGVATPTAFVQSLDRAQPLSDATTTASAKDKGASREGMVGDKGSISTRAQPTTSATQTTYLNHLFDDNTFREGLAYSKHLSEPYITPDRTAANPVDEEREKQEHEAMHSIRAEAVSRILSPQNASSRQRTRINVQRCIEEFGRHNTDGQLAAQDPLASEKQLLKQRIGPDTGSSEVQIAILTAKIRILAAEFQGRSRNDKVNKRNLRLLLHRRQKLLKYLERKERGGERWKHLLETLGLTEATWKGEISVQ